MVFLFLRFDNYDTITNALREFYALFLNEIGYLQNVCNIVVFTLLSVSLVILCFISWAILYNVYSVFPSCQHCLVGGSLAHSLPPAILQKIYKFYLNNENRFNLLEDEEAAKRCLEQEEDPDFEQDRSNIGSENDCCPDDVSLVLDTRLQVREQKVMHPTSASEAVVAKCSPSPGSLQKVSTDVESQDEQFPQHFQSDIERALDRVPKSQHDTRNSYKAPSVSSEKPPSESLIAGSTRNENDSKNLEQSTLNQNDLACYKRGNSPNNLEELEAAPELSLSARDIKQITENSKRRRRSTHSAASSSVVLKGLKGFVSAIRKTRPFFSGQSVAFVAKPVVHECQALVPSESATKLENDGTDYFVKLMQERSARNLPWYLWAGVHRTALALVLGLCICLWLLPVRNYPYFTNTANLIRGVRRTGGDVMQAVFRTRELIIADGFSRANTSALYADLTELRVDLLNDCEAFRRGGYIAAEQNTISIGADQLNIPNYNVLMYQVHELYPFN